MNNIDNGWSTWAVVSTLFQSQVNSKGITYINSKVVEYGNGVQKVEKIYYTVYNTQAQKEEINLPGSKVDLYV